MSQRPPKKAVEAKESSKFQEILASFDYQPKTRLIFGENSVQRVGELTAELGANHVLLVTDAGIVAAGHADKVSSSLAAKKIRMTVYDQTRENPTTGDVSECVAVAKKAKVDFLIGLGGGSSMDTAKGTNFVLTNGGRMQDYWGVGKAKKDMLPLIAIPTTAGTGSECQSAALITDEETHQKMACLDPKAAARVAILDPLLTVSQPPRVTACTGIDALSHALESAVTTKRTSISKVFSKESFALCSSALAEVLKNPSDLAARSRMQLGAALAGFAIENSMLGAAHSAANPLTAHYGIVHGQAVGLMLPHVVHYNAGQPDIKRLYEDMTGQSVAQLVKLLQSLLKVAGLAAPLRDLGIKRSKIPSLAEEAAKQWTANFNPRPISKTDFEKIYEAAY